MARAFVLAAVLLVGGLAVACEEEPSYELFRSELRDGASCGRLFEIRNDLDPKDPNHIQINDDLAAIGCFSSSSNRTDGR